MTATLLMRRLGLMAFGLWVGMTGQRILAAELPVKGAKLELKFKAIDGRNVDLDSMRGKVVLIEFWATWCGPCNRSLPTKLQSYEKHQSEGFEVVGISLDRSRSALDYFIRKHSIPWPQHFDGKGLENPIAQRLGVTKTPTSWLVDKKGYLVDLDAETQLEDKVEKLLRAR